MVKTIHIRTIISLILLPIAIYQEVIGFTLVAIITTCVSFMFAVIDNQVYTGKLQHFSLVVITGLFAYIVERHATVPIIASLTLFVSLFAIIGRLFFIKFFSYSKYRFLELILLVIVMMSMAYMYFSLNFKGILLIPFLLMLMPHVMMTMNIILNAYQLDKGITEEYQAKKGTTAPDFALPDQFGNLVQLSDYKNKRHVLVIFVRGNWCPYCHMVMRTYMRNNHKFNKKNILLLTVGPDPVGINKEMAKNLGLEYKVLSDDKMRTANQYGIILPDFSLPGATKHDEGMPLPASFLIDKEGIVRYTSRTTKVGEFLDPNLIFPIVESLN